MQGFACTAIKQTRCFTVVLFCASTLNCKSAKQTPQAAIIAGAAELLNLALCMLTPPLVINDAKAFYIKKIKL